jgi:DNA-binding response OmpR family regulator
MRRAKFDAHLLVVEENLNARALLERYLTRRGCKMTTAGDGLSAYDSFNEEPADLVITDYKMPRCDGLMLVARLFQEHPAVPIIMMIADADADADVQAALADGLLAALVEKPVNLREIEGRIQGVLNARGNEGHG